MQNFATNRRGQVLIYAIIIIALLVTFISVLVGNITSNSQTLGHETGESLALQTAETGIDRAIWCLNHPAESGCQNYTGENQTVGAGDFTVTVTPSGNNRIVRSTGTVGSGGRTVEVLLTNASSVDASFFYGVQAGVGGFLLSNNAFVNGNIFSAGSVIGGNGSYIAGDAILTVSDPTQDAVSDPSVSPLSTLSFGSNGSTNDVIAQSFVPTVTDRVFSVDLKIAKTNSPTSVVTLYIYSDSSNNPGSDLSGGGQQLNVGIPNDTPTGWEIGWTNQTFSPSINPVLQAGQKYWFVLRTSSASSTKYWKVVRGTDDTPYADGTGKIDGDTTAMPAACAPAACDIALRVNVGGVAPTLNIPNVNGTAHARNITDTTMGQKAYYQNLSGTVRAAGGSDTCAEAENGPNCFDNAADEAPQNFPISEAQITQMEAQAAAGGTTTCSPTCTITGTTSLGPKKYVGDLLLDNNAIVTLVGTIWVDGNISIQNNSVLKLDNAYGDSSGVIIADAPSNPTAKGKVLLSNNGNLQGNATAGTYIMAISMFRDPSNSQSAITVSNNLTAGILYAPVGIADISNNANLKEVTAQKIVLQNNASVTYESGLADVNFSGGPGGSWQIESQSWREILQP